MAELPTGTVTFLFTDIEGSTRLLQDLGERFTAVRDEHATILRRAVAEHGGVEVSTQGDSFFVVFSSAVRAVRAAVAAQRGLAEHEWSLEAPIRVRMGLHTGPGTLGGEDYIGIDVNRAARIAAAAHGGQVLLSEATRRAVDGALPDGTFLRDLGEHRLKDIARPEVLSDVAIQGLPSDFPAPRTLDARPINLPVQLTSFVGREREAAEVQALLRRTRLLTLTGAGGTGKTRLALKVATDAVASYRDGAAFVDLSSVTDPGLVPSALAQGLGVREEAGRPILESVKDHLRERELLLVVDNYEQVTAAAPVVEELLTAAPSLTVVVTSRVVLSVRGEHEYAVPPLELPDPRRLPDLPTLRRVEAVRLFTERAMAASPRFGVTEENAPAVAEITARLDGLPLAIELAATRTKVLTPQQILPRLEKSLALLTSGVRTLPDRQRTLRGAIAWSHDLLEPEERRLFAWLSVFSGGWTLESAEAVCDAVVLGADILEGLASLVDKSLIRRADTGGHGARFAMLETIREFGQERLQEGGDLDLVLRRHGEHYLDLAVEAEAHLTAEDQGEWLDRCELEHANLRNALRWAIETGRAARAQDAAAALWRFWQQRGHLDEGRRWFDEVLAMPAGRDRTVSRARALIGAGGIAWWQMDREATGRCYDEAVSIERELGDPARLGDALYNQAFVVAASNDIEGASRVLRESLDLFRRVGHEPGIAQVLVMLVIGEAQAGNWDRVVSRLEEAVAIVRRLGNPYNLANDLVWLAIGYGRTGRSAEARAAALESLSLFRGADNPTGIALAFQCLAFLALWEGRHEAALRLAAASETLDELAGAVRTKGFAGLMDGDPAAEAAGHLSEEVARRVREEGRGMTVDEAAAVAMGGA